MHDRIIFFRKSTLKQDTWVEDINGIHLAAIDHLQEQRRQSYMHIIRRVTKTSNLNKKRYMVAKVIVNFGQVYKIKCQIGYKVVYNLLNLLVSSEVGKVVTTTTLGATSSIDHESANKLLISWKMSSLRFNKIDDA